MATDAALEMYKLYRDAGVAALFIVLYLMTLVAFYRYMLKSTKDCVAQNEKVIAALAEANKIADQYREMAKEVRETLDKNVTHQAEFMSYLRGRDGDWHDPPSGGRRRG